MPRKKELLSGCVFAAFLGFSCAAALTCLPRTLATLETPAVRDLLNGAWTPRFEKSLRDTLPVEAASRDVWGRTEYALFRQGRKGVVVGTDGWLFTDEEFSCPAEYFHNLVDNLLYVERTRDRLAEKNVRLLVNLVPAKARLYPEHLGANRLPACRATLYKHIRDFLTKNGTPVTSLLSAMQDAPVTEDLYLKTDTHWSPIGAALAAQVTAEAVATFKDLDLPPSRFVMRKGGTKELKGDLTGYLPGVDIPADHVPSYVAGRDVASAAQDLFGGETPMVTLVGTSYSANPAWGYEGFLKTALKTDVLNAADQGLGPFVVMDKYLADESWKTAPPRLVVWEMPERYFLTPHGVAR